MEGIWKFSKTHWSSVKLY